MNNKKAWNTRNKQNKTEWTDRRELYRSKRYIPEKDMTNKELREENNKPITGQTETRSRAIQTGKFVSEALKVYISGDEEKFKTYSDRLQKLVQTMYKNSIEGNNSTVQEMLNRLEGKVRDEIHVDRTISKHIPDQDQESEIIGRYIAEKEEESSEERKIN